MSPNQFFEKKGPFSLNEISDYIGLNKKFESSENLKILGIESLSNANKNDITFLSGNKYTDESIKTKASVCITSDRLTKFIPKSCVKINVKNVMLAVSKVSRMFYPNADLDYPDNNLIDSNEIKNKFPGVIFGKNVLIGKNVEIGNSSFIGSNSIIESNVKIGKNCLIGSFVSIKKSIIGDYVNIKNGSKIGTKGFGFIPVDDKNQRLPHIGKVVIYERAEIGANCTIDRGSVVDTIIGKNTFLDNQIQIGHNVRIGNNCILVAQVAIAGSTVIGNNVTIGGQAGISGHLKIGNNVRIGGASGVTKDVPDNTKVMGYPAVPIREFVKSKVKNEK